MRKSTKGFTLIEVLAAMLLIAIVLPAVMKGITIAQSAGSDARRRMEAAGLAESKLAELVVTGDWQNGGMNGTFTDWPDYRWQSSTQSWAGDTSGASLQQLDVRVIWTSRNREDSITVSTLAYARE